MLSDKAALQEAFKMADAFLSGCIYKSTTGAVSYEDIDMAVSFADLNVNAKFDSDLLSLRLIVRHMGKGAVQDWGIYEQSADPVAAMLSKFI